jgi:hypothetical protein
VQIQALRRVFACAGVLPADAAYRCIEHPPIYQVRQDLEKAIATSSDSSYQVTSPEDAARGTGSS